MNGSSRGPRPQVVDEKKFVRPKAPKRPKAPRKEKASEPRKAYAPALTAVELAECAALDKVLREYNAARRRKDRLTDIRLAEIAAQYGGSKHDSQWWAYRKGRKSLPEIDKLIVSWELDRRPQDLFAGWKFSHWTPLAPTRLQRVLDAFVDDDT